MMLNHTYIFFARSLKAELFIFVECTLEDSLIDAFKCFCFPVCRVVG